MKDRVWLPRRFFMIKAGAGLATASTAFALSAAAAETSPATPRTAQPLASTPGSQGACPAFASNSLMSLPLVQARPVRITTITVCTSPFRAQGPRIQTERLGRKTIVHNYGHGGTGWSLSWGSTELALRQVMATRERRIAVIGCGVIGLTTALLAQRSGLEVRIYAKERPPEVRSTFATGNWSPNSRFCTLDGATPEVTARWVEMWVRLGRDLAIMPLSAASRRPQAVIPRAFRRTYLACSPVRRCYGDYLVGGVPVMKNVWWTREEIIGTTFTKFSKTGMRF